MGGMGVSWGKVVMGGLVAGGGGREGGVQEAAVRIIRRAQWFLISLPICLVVVVVLVECEGRFVVGWTRLVVDGVERVATWLAAAVVSCSQKCIEEGRVEISAE